MTANQLARKLAKGNGKTVDELEAIIRQRNKDIETGGFARAFGVKVTSYEKYEWEKNNGRLGGKW